MKLPKPARSRALLSLLLVAPAIALLFAASPARALFTNGKLQVIQLDAGQGDGTVIITPGGQVALIDEGTNFTDGSSGPSCARVLSELQALGVTHVDLHFASHYHADHIGCITSLSGITIDAGWDRAASYTSATYTNYTNYLGAKRHTLTKSQVFTLDSLSAHPVKITCIALAGDGLSTSDENSKSLVLKLSYGEYDEVFGGDLTGYPSGTSSSNTNVETRVGPQVGKVEVYKVHHHGSAYASYDDWLNATQPKVGIISVGTGNSYGHPTAAALTRLHMHGARTYWTESGAGAAPNPSVDKVAGGMIRINAVWQPGGVDSILATGIADTLTNSGTAVDGIPPTVSLLSPTGGATLAAGVPTNVTWSAGDNVGVTAVDVAYSLDNGANWNPLLSGAPNTGTTPWSVPNVPTTQALARVVAHDAAGNTGTGSSNSVFTIADETAPSVAVSSPNGGESFAPGSVQNIDWNAADNVAVDSVNVDLSLHGAFGPWTPIQHGLANTGSTSWTLPAEGSDSALVRVIAFDHALNQTIDTSDSLFTIGSSTTGVGSGPAPRFALYPPSPSPSMGNVTIRFSLARVTATRIEVLDVRGRSVWRSDPMTLAPGLHGVTWQGQDMRGSAAGSGVYFVRVAAGSEVRTTKLVLLR